MRGDKNGQFLLLLLLLLRGGPGGGGHRRFLWEEKGEGVLVGPKGDARNPAGALWVLL